MQKHSLERTVITLFTLPCLILLGLLIFLIVHFKLDFLEGTTLIIALLAPTVVVFAALYRRFFNTLDSVAVQLDGLANEEFTVWHLAKYSAGRVAGLKRDLHTIAKRIQNKRHEYAQNESFIFDFINELELPIIVIDSQSQVYHHNQAASNYYQKTNLLGNDLTSLGLSVDADKWQLEQNNQRHKVVAHALNRGNRHYRLLVFVSIEQSLRHNEKEAWQKLVRVLNHEVRNSLTPIYSMAQSLQELPKLTQSDLQTTMLNVIEKRAEHLLEFVASYSKLSQIPRAKLASVTTDAIAKRCEALFPEVDIIIEQNGTITCDIEQLEQALLNLVKNANEANLTANSSGVTIRINQTDNWQIAIEDNGIGVDLNDNLFVPFYSTKPEGSGIGLVLSRELIRNQNGELTLTNKTEKPGAIALIKFQN
ncbi:sensor histidine kinase [Pseudoalteromonas spongiae]|uniref:sensor histidine kinase n=1 Tax=Pseudoalteromonas spongiae TaxID=298657 RepID=UPI00026CA90E|nr:ATP-binding protein [Pseudoalteromonas spongiae]ATD01430.1 hypothetical protein PSPO_b1601 [Pseudoalteromonas spongiae UST010723-006]